MTNISTFSQTSLNRFFEANWTNSEILGLLQKAGKLKIKMQNVKHAA